MYETDNKNKIIFVCLFSILCIFLIRYQMPMNTPPTITLRDKFFEILAIFVSFIFYPFIIPLIITLPLFIKKIGFVFLVALIYLLRKPILLTIIYTLFSLATLPFLFVSIIFEILIFKTILNKKQPIND